MLTVFEPAAWLRTGGSRMEGECVNITKSAFLAFNASFVKYLVEIIPNFEAYKDPSAETRRGLDDMCHCQ